MLKYILKRLGLAIVILLGVSLIIYILVNSMDFDFVAKKMASLPQYSGSEQTAAEWRAKLGLSDGSFWSTISCYFQWLGRLCRFDLGNSFINNDSVLNVIVDHMGVSFAIAFVGTIFEYLIAIPLGVTAATHQYSIRDYIVTVLVIIGISLPSFFLARMLQNIFGYQLNVLPIGGMGDGGFFDYLQHITLPLVTLVVLGIGGTMRYMRTNMLEVLNSDYIRTARAKGLSERKVIYKHAFRNTMIPIVTMMAGILPTLFSGAMITEQIFDLPGIGNVALKAIMDGDVPFIMGYNMFLAFLSVIGVLLSDLMYMIVDPRVKLN